MSDSEKKTIEQDEFPHKLKCDVCGRILAQFKDPPQDERRKASEQMLIESHKRNNCKGAKQ